MSLDQNLFTLNVVPQAQDPNIVDLIDPTGDVHYQKERIVGGPVYTANLYEPLSESLLATVTAPSATSKAKTIELHNPSVPVELKHTGTISFRWGFKWEEHDFEWKKEECYMLRKPDPPVLVAITKTQPAGKTKTTSVQILDYNLNRFDIEDRKGLEIVILAAMLTFQDYSDDYRAKREDSATVLSPPSTQRIDSTESAPDVPPRPVKTGAERIAELQTGDLNDVLVQDEGSYEDYAQLCTNLLESDNMLYIVVRSSSAATVPKVLQVVEQAKRLRHKSGEDEDLHQYVSYDREDQSSAAGAGGKKAPKVINLDDGGDKGKGKGKGKYLPPTSLSIHLSKIPMPELEPKLARSDMKTKPTVRSKSHERERVEDKINEWKAKSSARPSVSRRTSEHMQSPLNLRSNSPPSPSPPPTNKLARPRPHSQGNSRTPSHETHPYQPSPSPSQLNNPAVYVAPLPRHPPHPPAHPQPLTHPNSNPYPNSFYGPGSYSQPPSMPTPRPASMYGASPDTRPEDTVQNPGSKLTTTAVVTGFLDKFHLR